MSNPLSCSASSCTYNKTGDCYASIVKVEGASAITTSQTTCASYESREGKGFTNSIGGQDSAKTSSISCAASNCVHNSSGACVADSVHINMDNATCETFRSK